MVTEWGGGCQQERTNNTHTQPRYPRTCAGQRKEGTRGKCRGNGQERVDARAREKVNAEGTVGEGGQAVDLRVLKLPLQDCGGGEGRRKG